MTAAAALAIVGACFVVTAAALISPSAGFAAAGLICLAAGFLLYDPPKGDQ